MNLLLIRAEWRRFRANPANLALLGVFLLVFSVSACWSGLSAREHRLESARELAESEARMEAAKEALGALAGTAPESQRVTAAFNFARHDGPRAQLPALGGLALTSSAFQVLSPSQHVTVTNRFTDGRKSERLGNPLLSELGLMDFAAVLALLIPVAAVGLAYGLVQEDREQGRWRLVAALHPLPWRVLRAALVVRWLALLVVVLVPSALAFVLDPGASLSAFGLWLAAASAMSAIWIIVAGLFCLLPISSGSAALGGLAVWILTCFVTPPVMALMTEREVEATRLAVIAEMRAIQLDVEERSDELLREWYAENPDWRHPSRTTHAWPVSFMPRYEAESSRIRPLIRQFDLARAERDTALARWVWLSPSLAMLYVADHLAGIDSGRYLAYLSAVDTYDDRWREQLMPHIMSYQGIGAKDMLALPPFHFGEVPAPPYHLLLQLWTLALGLSVVCHTLRGRSNHP